MKIMMMTSTASTVKTRDGNITNEDDDCTHQDCDVFVVVDDGNDNDDDDEFE